MNHKTMKTKKAKEKLTWKQIKGFLLSELLVLIGAAGYAAGFQFFMYPNDIVTGGVTGISMIVNYLTGIPVGVMIVALNIPLFLFSWRKFGTRFLVASLTGMLGSSIFVELFSVLQKAYPIEITSNPLLAAIYGGVIYGIGLGIVYHANGTTGGTDIIAKFLRHRFQHINFSTFILASDVTVVVIFAIIFGLYERSMYAIIAMFIGSRAIDLVLYGAINSKVCYIITDEPEKVKNALIEKLDRGVTFLHGKGGYSGAEKEIVLCVIKQAQIVTLKRLVKDIDEHAFMIVSDSREVFGEGFSYIGSD